MYFVAFCEDWCATVPVCWVDEDLKIIKWPLKDENATKDSMKAVKPKDNWVSVKYTRLLGPYDNYKTARAIEIAAVDLSTNDETPLENITNKAEVSKRRPRKRPARFISSDDGSSDEIETDRTRNNKNALKPIFVYKSNSKKQENPVKIKANELENASTLPKVMNIINDKNKQYKNDNNNTYNDDDLLDTQPLDYGNFFDDHPIEIEPKNSDCDSQLPTNNKPLVRSVVKSHISIYVTSKEKSRSYKVLTPRNTATKCTTTPVRLFEQNATTTNEVSEQGATTSTMQVPEQEVITTVTKEFSTPSHQSCCQKKNPDHRW